MNERDKELALKASDSKTGWLDRQKFADLIRADEREVWERRVARLQSLMDVRESQPNKPRNFCPRCGKRTPDPTTIHTCTPPQEKNT